MAEKSISFVINVSVFCSVNIQESAMKGVNFRLSGADLSFLRCVVTLSSLIGITNFSGEFAAAVFGVEESRTVASSTLK